MRRNFKKLLFAIMTVLALTAFTAPVYAETKTFDITVPGDPISRRTTKADSEQKFYVTGTSFNISGTYLRCISRKLSNPDGVYSYIAYISSSNRSASAAYRSYASSGVYYYMEASSSASNFHVTGRYTP